MEGIWEWLKEMNNNWKLLKLVSTIFHFADIISDYVLAITYFCKGDWLYGTLTISLVIFPLIYVAIKREIWTLELKNGVRRYILDGIPLIFYIILGVEIANLYNSPLWNWLKKKKHIFFSKYCTYTEVPGTDDNEITSANVESVQTINNEDIDDTMIIIRSNMLLLIAYLEDLPQLTLQLSIWIREGKNSVQNLNMIFSTLSIGKTIWIWDINWRNRKNFTKLKKARMFLKWATVFSGRVMALAIGLAFEWQFKLVTGAILTAHCALMTWWYIYERKFKIENCTRHVVEYSNCSTIKKSIEAAIIDPYTPRSDRYAFDYLKLEEPCKNCECINIIRTYMKLYKPYINCIITSILFVCENLVIFILVYLYSNDRNKNILVWGVASFGLSLIGISLIIYYRYDVRNATKSKNHDRRDIGKLHEYLEITEDAIDHNITTTTTTANEEN